MPTPDFILRLRKSIGHDLLWLNGVTAFVRDDQGRVLLGRRSDTGQWALVYGINEPGEDPADTVIREVREETGVDVIVTALAAVTSSREAVTYANGDRTMYMDHLFICRPDPSGNANPFVGDEESLSVGWFDPAQLPAPLAQTTVERMTRARTYLKRLQGGDAHALFRVNGRQLPADSDQADFHQSDFDRSQADH